MRALERQRPRTFGHTGEVHFSAALSLQMVPVALRRQGVGPNSGSVSLPRELSLHRRSSRPHASRQIAQHQAAVPGAETGLSLSRASRGRRLPGNLGRGEQRGLANSGGSGDCVRRSPRPRRFRRLPASPSSFRREPAVRVNRLFHGRSSSSWTSSVSSSAAISAISRRTPSRPASASSNSWAANIASP
jgi:hypothetical protein